MCVANRCGSLGTGYAWALVAAASSSSNGRRKPARVISPTLPRADQRRHMERWLAPRPNNLFGCMQWTDETVLGPMNNIEWAETNTSGKRDETVWTTTVSLRVAHRTIEG